MKNHLLVLSLLLPSAVMGGQSTYLCTVNQVLELSAKGIMEEHKGIYEVVVGQSFSVNRDTGEMLGLPFETKSYREVKVFDRGSAQNAYKATVISHPPNTWIQYIYITEFRGGDKKPFWGTEGGNMVFSGVCE